MFPCRGGFHIQRHFIYLDIMVCVRCTAEQLPLTVDIELAQLICLTGDRKKLHVTRQAKETAKFEEEYVKKFIPHK